MLNLDKLYFLQYFPVQYYTITTQQVESYFFLQLESYYTTLESNIVTLAYFSISSVSLLARAQITPGNVKTVGIDITWMGCIFALVVICKHNRLEE